jgi:hypothetical protein
MTVKFCIFKFCTQIFCLDDLVLIKKQLILNSYESVRLEEEGSKKKNTANISGVP